MCSSIAYVTVRQLARTEHPLVIVFYFPLVATPLAIPWAAAEWVTPSAAEVLLLVAIGVTTQVGQVFLTMGLAVERAGRATSVGYLQIVFAMGWQLVVFGDAPAAADDRRRGADHRRHAGGGRGRAAGRGAPAYRRAGNGRTARATPHAISATSARAARVSER